MKASESPYKHVFFRINQSIYEWGKGWTINHDNIDLWEAEITQLLKELGLSPKIKTISAASQDGVNESGENLYMHPMDFSGIIHKDNIVIYAKILHNFKSKYWSYKSFDIFNLEDESNRMGYIGKIEENKKEFAKLSTPIETFETLLEVPVTIEDLLQVIHYTVIKSNGENTIILKELESISTKIKEGKIKNPSVNNTAFWKYIINNYKKVV